MSKNHEFVDEDEDKKSQVDTDRDQVLDLSVKSRDNSLNKRKNRPVKSVEVEDESIEEAAELDDCESTGDHVPEFADTELEPPKAKKLKTKSYTPDYQALDPKPSVAGGTKKQMRFQCRFCVYKSHSVSLMQNHIYRHIDTTPYACYYCGHKSTTKSTIMVHIELCHPNMDVKIKENRVKEEDYYLDLNSSACYSAKTEARPRKSHDSPDQDKVNSSLSFKSFNSISPSMSSESSLCSSPSQSPNPHKSEQLQFIKHSDEDLLNQDALEEKDSSQYSSVYNRPKQYFGSLYEPDKQYSCKLCTYTTNHKPSMEDHVYVHTNKRPYRCGYCNEEIYTRYAATYHNKYKHPGEARNFIKDEQDVSIYYVNRAKKSSGQVEVESEAAKTCKKPKLSEPRAAAKTTCKPVADARPELSAKTPPQAGYDFGLALKMYQIQLQSLMAANYLQSIRSNQPSGSLMASYFGLNGDQLQQLTHYLSVKARMDGGDGMTNGEEDVESSLNETENSDRNESLNS